jgi:lysine 6-dehydrogenase
VLQECGFFSTDPIQAGGRPIIPRQVLEALLEERLRLGDEKDATLLRIVVSGKKSGVPQTHIFEMVDHADPDKKYTSMSRTTCFPASVAAQMIASGQVSERGVVFPERVFNSDLFPHFMEGLKNRGVVISHETSPGERAGGLHPPE